VREREKKRRGKKGTQRYREYKKVLIIVIKKDEKKTKAIATLGDSLDKCFGHELEIRIRLDVLCYGLWEL